VFDERPARHGQEVHVFKGFEQIKPGSLTQAEYDDAVADLVAYLQWMGEPGAAAASASAWACGCCCSWACSP
jgi:cytochrome c1